MSRPPGLTDAPAELRPRLNPLAFPTDTDFRLLLLIAAVIGSGLFVYNWIYFDLPQGQADTATYQHCAQQASTLAPNDPLTASSIFEACRAPVEQRKAVWMLSGIGLIFGLAFCLYLLAPEIKLRRRRFVTLTPDDAPDAVIALDELRRKAGLKVQPRFVWDPMNGSAVGLAFGRKGRYFVALTGGLVTRFYTDRPAFESVVLHELGHLKNGDVDKTYLAIGIWQAFVAAALTPLLVTVILAPSPGAAIGDVWILGWRVVALVVLVYLIRNAVLRSREVYADLRAAELQGSGDPLGRVLASSADPGVRPWWRPLLMTHPSMSTRRQALIDPRPLFGISPWTALAAGLTAGIAYPSVVTLILLIFTGTRSSIWYWTTGEVAGLLVSALAALLIAGVVGVGLWRAGFAAIVDPRRGIPTALVAGATALGAGVGGWVAFDGGFPLVPSDIGSAVAYFFVFTGIVAVLGAGTYAILRWFEGVTRDVQSASAAAGVPVRWWPSFLAIALLLACWFGVCLQARDLLQVAAGNGLAPPLYLLLPLGGLLGDVPLGLIALICLVLLPLIATSVSRPVKQPLPVPVRPGFRRTFGFSAGAGAIYLVVVASLHWAVGPTAHMTDMQILIVFGAEVALAIVVQCCLAVAVSATAPDKPLQNGSVAIFVAGVLMALSAFSVNIAFGGHPDAGALLSFVAAILLLGGGASISLAWLTAALTKPAGGG